MKSFSNFSKSSIYILALCPAFSQAIIQAPHPIQRFEFTYTASSLASLQNLTGHACIHA